MLSRNRDPEYARLSSAVRALDAAAGDPAACAPILGWVLDALRGSGARASATSTTLRAGPRRQASRRLAVELLGRLCEVPSLAGEGVPRLVERVRDVDPECRCVALEAVLRLVRGGSYAPTLSLYQQCVALGLQDDDERVRRLSASCVALVGCRDRLEGNAATLRLSVRLDAMSRLAYTSFDHVPSLRAHALRLLGGVANCRALGGTKDATAALRQLYGRTMPPWDSGGGGARGTGCWRTRAATWRTFTGR